MKKIIVLGALLFAVTACTPNYNDPKPARPTKGSPQAQVVVEEFGDFQCPACGAAYPVLKELQKKYGDRIYWKYFEFPLIDIHPFSFNAAMAAECANDQGKFWEMHDTLYENQTKLTNPDLYGYAAKLGLNAENFKACYKSRAKSATIRADMAEGDKRKVNSTPSVFLNGELLQNWGDLDVRLAAIFATDQSIGTKKTK